ncbi:response regulator transcription factor [Azospirillum sp. TSA2s]|uniref:helix-turn-helix transcriptional regulator n=1 Tax=Azospirillum sp. TSA2s TaxID=709810 RepID=UPI0010A9CE93|nr:LuxR C-terminal-related transcriptional regulator [Azospirillum sp. TSA2s]QCG95003.1 response regulator transcription factor [Azospirillum sp. TSA2s]
MLSLDSCDQKYLDAVTAVYGPNGQHATSTIRQNDDVRTTSALIIGEIERFALIDALTRAEGQCGIKLAMDGRGATAVVTATFRLPLGGVNLVDAATLAALVDAVEVTERPAATHGRQNVEHVAMSISAVQRSAAMKGLTPREMSVFRALAGGGTNKQIAAELKLSVDTVKIYMRAILRKIGASNRSQACALATQLVMGG